MGGSALSAEDIRAAAEVHRELGPGCGGARQALDCVHGAITRPRYSGSA
jgi:hypothetical protein